MHFLITNDDGYGAPGIVALEKALLPLGRVTVVAPRGHLSGCSHQVTTDEPLQIQKYDADHYEIGGLPADCARLGILHFAPQCDWVISGLNEGANVGCDIYYSGTVAGAREAALLGKPAIAISHYHTSPRSINWETAESYVKMALLPLLREPPLSGALWNVNLPAPERLHRHTVARHCSPDAHPLAVAYELVEGEARYCHGRYHDRPRSPGSDVDVCFSGDIAISRIPLYG